MSSLWEWGLGPGPGTPKATGRSDWEKKQQSLWDSKGVALPQEPRPCPREGPFFSAFCRRAGQSGLPAARSAPYTPTWGWSHMAGGSQRRVGG